MKKKMYSLLSIVLAFCCLFLNSSAFVSAEEEQEIKPSTFLLPEVISQTAGTNTNHVRRLWEREERLDTLVFQNSDGTNTMYTYGCDVKYVDEKGIVQDKSNILSTSIDNSTLASSYAYVNSKNNIKTYFPKTLTEATGITVKADSYTLSMAPKNAFPSAAKCQNEGSANNAVTYKGAFNNTSAVCYTPLFTGFKEDIILFAAPPSSSFSFLVNTDGLFLELYEDRILLFDSSFQEVMTSNKTNEFVGYFSPIIVYDSAGNITRKNKYELQQISDSAWEVTLVVDSEFLSSSDTIYPITVDPSVNMYSGSQDSKKIEDMTLSYSGNSSYTSGSVYRDDISSPCVQRTGSSTINESRIVYRFPGLEDSSNTLGNLAFLRSRGTMNNSYLWIEDITSTSQTSFVDVYSYTTTWTETSSGLTTSSLPAFNSTGKIGATQMVGGGCGRPSINASSGSGNWYPIPLTNIMRDWITYSEWLTLEKADINSSNLSNAEKTARISEIETDLASMGSPSKGIMLCLSEGESAISLFFRSTETNSTSVCLVINYTDLSYPVSGAYNGDPFGCTCSYHAGKHYGLDIIGVAEGTPIKASGMGKVIFRGESSSYGYYLGVLYGNKCVALYAHLQSLPTVTVGTTVYQNSSIALLGNTGGSTAKHLHLGIAIDVGSNENSYSLMCGNTHWVDPETWLDGDIR